MHYLLNLVLLISAGLSASDKLVTKEYLDQKLKDFQQDEMYKDANNIVIRSFGFPVLVYNETLGLKAATCVNNNANNIAMNYCFEQTVNTIVDMIKQKIWDMLKSASQDLITEVYINQFWGQQQEGKSFLEKLENLQQDIKKKIEKSQLEKDKKQHERELSIKRKHGYGNFLFGTFLGVTVGILGMRYYYGIGSFQDDATWAGNKAYSTGKVLVIAGYNKFVT